MMEKFLSDFDMYLFPPTLTLNEENHSHDFMIHFKQLLLLFLK
jgi:hypothetical protein